MRAIILGSALMAAALSIGTSPAHADRYRWCAEYSGGRGGSTNCYFVTLQQCQAAVSGNGGFCRQNYAGDPIPRVRDGYERRRFYH